MFIEVIDANNKQPMLVNTRFVPQIYYVEDNVSKICIAGSSGLYVNESYGSLLDRIVNKRVYKS